MIRCMLDPELLERIAARRAELDEAPVDVDTWTLGRVSPGGVVAGGK